MAHKVSILRCGATGLVIFKSELDAKIALAKRIRQDKGETRYFKCNHHNHYHLTAMPINRPIELEPR